MPPTAQLLSYQWAVAGITVQIGLVNRELLYAVQSVLWL